MPSEINLPPGRYAVAVSGGVDSVVLLDVLSKLPGLELIVAHFDHGIRVDSGADADFVKGLAEKYNLKFESKRENLGTDASEAFARARRYAFLRSVANKYQAKLVTAHHNDDVIESIAINLVRGTGWRGLAVLDSDIIRPLTTIGKAKILDYAAKNKLNWHEDSTNASDKYLRNRIRQKTKSLSEPEKQKITDLWMCQKELKKLINTEVASLFSRDLTQPRDLFRNVGDNVAIEGLRYLTEARLTRPQMKLALEMIRTALPKKLCYPGGDIKISFTSRNFIIEVLK